MDWNAPSEGEFFTIKNHVGALVILAVNEYLPAFTTSMGVSPAVKAEVAIIDGPGEGQRYPDALFFGKKIVPQMKTQVGSVILGRIITGTARPGQSAPYQLAKASLEDAELANKWVEENGSIESKPVDVSAGGGQYAPDNENWASQRQAAPAAPQQAQQGVRVVQGAGLPTPPAYPATYGGATTDDEPPF